jgi:hypothetical protein
MVVLNPCGSRRSFSDSLYNGVAMRFFESEYEPASEAGAKAGSYEVGGRRTHGIEPTSNPCGSRSTLLR